MSTDYLESILAKVAPFAEKKVKRPAEVFNANYARVTGLRAIAEKRGQDPKVVVDTFMDKTVTGDGEPRLTETPLSYAPKWQVELDIGLHRRST